MGIVIILFLFLSDIRVIIISTRSLLSSFTGVLTVRVNDIEGYYVLREADCEESARDCQ